VDTERAIVNGQHMAPDMAKILEKFIDIFVLCPTCKLPEITMKVKKTSIKIDCAACGHNGALATMHKYTTPHSITQHTHKPTSRARASACFLNIYCYTLARLHACTLALLHRACVFFMNARAACGHPSNNPFNIGS
jgi:ribosomal protein L37AE/L43A